MPDISPGASPRARGNPVGVGAHREELGCIPACAGEPAPSCAWSPRPRVHPRVRGGTTPCPVSWAAVLGASPRARGNHYMSIPDYKQIGCIPACAGEPHRPDRQREVSRVHPRVRGGTRSCSPLPQLDRGASPRARGNRQPEDRAVPAAGCIPACAGEPRSAAAGRAAAGVHPRVRGGTRSTSPAVSSASGASPRARGNPQVVRVGGRGCIPACAGEPCHRRRQPRVRGVHPRVRGGTRNGEAAGLALEGASPRARGNHVLAQNLALAVRCIPACAGEPQAG